MHRLQLLMMALVFPVLPAWADTYNIVGTISSSEINGIPVGDQWYGTLTTDGVCQICIFGDTPGLLDISILILGQHYNALAADFPFSVTFYRASLSLRYLDSADDPSLNILGNSFELQLPGGGDPADRKTAYGSVFISKVPEPASVLLFAMGLVLALFASVRHRWNRLSHQRSASAQGGL